MKKVGRVNNTKGRRWEQEVRKMYEKMGYHCFRTRGVRGSQICDLIALHPIRKLILLIECKNYKKGLTPNKRNEILMDVNQYNGIYELLGVLAEK